MRGLVWFRNDLRLHDNEALHQATQTCDELLCVYCIDTREFANTPYGFKKMGPYRLQFLLETLEYLKASLQSIGGDLLVYTENPEQALPQLLAAYNIEHLFFQYQVGTEEAATETKIVDYCRVHNIQTSINNGATLFHKDDIPFKLTSLPNIFTDFRKATEKSSTVRSLFPSPTNVVSITTAEPSTIPTSIELGFEIPKPDPRAAIKFKGGEGEALKRLQHYFWETEALKTYKETRNELLGASYSSKFSAWLALGCISPRTIYWEIKKFEQDVVANSSTYWLIFELLWRDYFHFVAQKYGNLLFQKGGIKQQPQEWSTNLALFENWRTGNTGVAFIDANMRELLHTGFMSNRGRQNVASYLVKDLKLDWRMGAAWFEHCLIDYDVASNYGNWSYIAGIGNDPREDRYFNIPTQVAKYDPEGKYVRHWLG